VEKVDFEQVVNQNSLLKTCENFKANFTCAAKGIWVL